jgi:phage baseplate assembly protein W
VADARLTNLMGTDLKVIPPFVADDATPADVRARWTPRTGQLDRSQPHASDMETVAGRENLAQAIILRLLTPMGALAALGHGSYGSRLHLLIGERKNSATRNLCRAFVLEAIAQEPRVEPRAVAFTFDELAERIDSFAFTLAVQPVAGGDPVSLGLEVGL